MSNRQTPDRSRPNLRRHRSALAQAITPTLPSWLVPVVARVGRFNAPYTSAETAHRLVREQALRPQPYAPPRNLRDDVVLSIEHDRGWPIYTVTPANVSPRSGVVYAHGGGWFKEIAVQHWHLIAEIAAEASAAVVVPIYPLVPFGTAEPTTRRMVELVLATRAEYGNTVVMGDSAGGQIALSTALALRDQQVTLPRTVLISPALDLTLSNPQIDEVQSSDPWLARAGTQVFIEHWCGGLTPDDPRVSPLLAELDGLGPITMFSGTRDILNPDSRLLHQKALAAGVESDYHEQRGLLHVYPLTPTPEGARARATIVARVQESRTGS